MSVDPDLAATNEAYAYADDNPLSAADPTGTDCVFTGPFGLSGGTESSGPDAYSYSAASVHTTHNQPVDTATNYAIPCEETWEPPKYEEPYAEVSISNYCSENVAEFIVTLQPVMQSTVFGLVEESGMTWWLNNRLQPQTAPHAGVRAQSGDYYFHGNFNPQVPRGARAPGSALEFWDLLAWQNIFGGRTNLEVFGTVHLGKV
jgi:hypothetical protein